MSWQRIKESHNVYEINNSLEQRNNISWGLLPLGPSGGNPVVKSVLSIPSSDHIVAGHIKVGFFAETNVVSHTLWVPCFHALLRHLTRLILTQIFSFVSDESVEIAYTIPATKKVVARKSKVTDKQRQDGVLKDLITDNKPRHVIDGARSQLQQQLFNDMKNGELTKHQCS